MKNTTFERIYTRLGSHRAAIAAGVFACIGILLLARSFAGTSPTSIAVEPETGVITEGAQLKEAADTSGGKTVIFGMLGAPGAPLQYPAQLLTLNNWKVTLPVGSPNSATEIKQPQLATFTDANYFHLNDSGSAVIFKAIAGGARTSTGTAYPRAELREMANNGTTNAAWTCASAARSMYLEQALTHTTIHKPEATIAQIHDASNDLLMVKYFGPNYPGATGSTDTGSLEARLNNDSVTIVLDPAYKLGDPMTLEVTVVDGGVSIIYHNLRSGVSKVTTPVAFKGVSGGCYFKAGVYIQACTKIDIYGQTNTTCVNKNFATSLYETDPYAYSEVAITKLTVR